MVNQLVGTSYRDRGLKSCELMVDGRVPGEEALWLGGVAKSDAEVPHVGGGSRQDELVGFLRASPGRGPGEGLIGFRRLIVDPVSLCIHWCWFLESFILLSVLL